MLFYLFLTVTVLALGTGHLRFPMSNDPVQSFQDNPDGTVLTTPGAAEDFKLNIK